MSIHILPNELIKTFAGFGAATMIYLFPICAHCAPQLVTPQLPVAVQDQPYAASLMIGSATHFSNVSLVGLPTGLASTTSLTGTIAISGTPAKTGIYSLTVSATDTASTTLTATVSLAVMLPPAGASIDSMLSAGLAHTCAVVRGGVQCWGRNDVGQLGNGNTSDSLVPVDAIPAGNAATAISLGQFHSCAVVNGGVQCWGDNNFNKLGNALVSNSSNPMQAIGANLGAVGVAAGANHSCAVVNGGVTCWGRNNLGQIGNGMMDPVNGSPPAQAIAQGSNVIAVAAGNDFSCAVLGGGVQCWGLNDGGQLGNGGVNAGSSSPGDALPAGSGATALAVGYDHACAVVDSGLKCWGKNNLGQLGNNPTMNTPTPVQTIAPQSNVSAVAAGHGFTCALINSGVRCWGLNAYGNLGKSNLKVSSSKDGVSTMTPSQNATGVAAGDGHACAIAEGKVQCWGRNEFGQIGNGRQSESRVPVTVVANGSGVVAVSAGDGHSCLVANGGVQCWGSNSHGQLGNNSNQYSLTPVQAIVPGSAVTVISSGSRHTCAVVSGGVQCWGFNSVGQVGDGTTVDKNSPVQIIPPNSGATSVAAGYEHSCAAINGGVRCWGKNVRGQLGNGTTTQSLVPVVTIPDGSGVTSVSVNGGADGFSCATVNGGAQCWGWNNSGQLGNNSTLQSTTPVTALPAGSGVAMVKLGDSHVCALVNAGVQCWGANYNGQLGNGTTSKSLVPVQAIAANSVATMISTGSSYSCAVVSGGLRCWGDNSLGQLGNNSVTNSSVPVQSINAMANVTSVTSGHTHTCALINAGLACWGGNDVLQLGDANSSPAWSPETALIRAPNNVLVAVSSRKSHSGAGVFNIPVDLLQPSNGAVTVEPRAIGNGHTLVFTFGVNITSVGFPLSTIGSSSVNFSGNQVFVTLTNIPDNRRASVSLFNVNGSINVPPVSLGFIIGDINNTRSVNASDINGMKAHQGQAARDANFKMDVDASGAIDASDLMLVRSQSGRVLP
ncbi:MAG: RCC1 repeat-containing protein [Betaproteobacteria bacterium]